MDTELLNKIEFLANEADAIDAKDTATILRTLMCAIMTNTEKDVVQMLTPYQELTTKIIRANE